jgi:hypothetical protein
MTDRRPDFPLPRVLRLSFIAMTIAIAVTLYGLAAYFVLPQLWSHHEHQPGLVRNSMMTTTTLGIPGDPINIGMVGSQDEMLIAMERANWHRADAIRISSSLEISESVLLDRAYADAPVSTLLYNGQPQAFAFEKAAGSSAKRRHHVRLWLALASGSEGRPVWLGAASFDRGVGFSRYTGQITHHIGPDLDEERDLLISDLVAAGMVESIYQVSGIGPTFDGRNGGGDPYFTDGEVSVAVLQPGDVHTDQTPPTLPNPAGIAVKDTIWSMAERMLRTFHLWPDNDGPTLND